MSARRFGRTARPGAARGRYPDPVGSPGAPDLSGRGYRATFAALPAFLSALVGAVDAHTVHFVPLESGGVVSARKADGAAEIEPDVLEVSNLVDEAARDWLSGTRPDAARLTIDGLGAIDVATVRTTRNEVRGALAVQRGQNVTTDLSKAMAEIELAAALVATVLDPPSAVAAHQALLGWAAAQVGGLAVFAISIDRMGVTNQVLGYRAGDLILRALVERLEAWAGPDGRVARVGGARYLAIRTDLADEAATLSAAEQLRTLLAEPVDVDGFAVSRSASIGVAADPDGLVQPAELVAHAVVSGGVARAAGGGVRRYDDAASMERLNRLRLELELHGALAGHQLRVHYQPERDLRTGRIVAVEALVRWQHPNRGLLGADSFVPFAEQTHTFAEVQRWVIEDTCRELASWVREGLAGELVLRVNVSADQVVRGEITDVLLGALDRNALRGEQVCIEITERRMPPEPAQLAAELSAWRARGVVVAIDDFGTGEGTLSHLLTLPFDALKIDQSFVSRLLVDERAAAVVTSVIELAHALGMQVVAEGVDGPDTAAALVRLGCDRGQGNALGEAVPPDELAALLRAQTADPGGTVAVDAPPEAPGQELSA